MTEIGNSTQVFLKTEKTGHRPQVTKFPAFFC